MSVGIVGVGGAGTGSRRSRDAVASHSFPAVLSAENRPHGFAESMPRSAASESNSSTDSSDE